MWTPPGVKHWHGASPTTAMTHLALTEALSGKAVDWMEKVTDEDYGALADQREDAAPRSPGASGLAAVAPGQPGAAVTAVLVSALGLGCMGTSWSYGARLGEGGGGQAHPESGRAWYLSSKSIQSPGHAP